MSKKTIEVDFSLGDVVEVIQHNRDRAMVGAIVAILASIDGGTRYAASVYPGSGRHETYSAREIRLHDPDEAVGQPEYESPE